MGQTSLDKQSALKTALAFSTGHRSFHAFQRLTLQPSCTNKQGELRDLPFKSIANTGPELAPAARNTSAE